MQVVVGGEEVKNDIHVLERMLKVFHAANLDRRSYVVVIGGGAVLDAVGFAAVDRAPRPPAGPAADHHARPGRLGRRRQERGQPVRQEELARLVRGPWAVINDIALLGTLPDRDFICGFSEAVKVALLKDPAMFADPLPDRAGSAAATRSRPCP